MVSIVQLTHNVLHLHLDAWMDASITLDAHNLTGTKGTLQQCEQFGRGSRSPCACFCLGCSPGLPALLTPLHSCLLHATPLCAREFNSSSLRSSCLHTDLSGRALSHRLVVAGGRVVAVLYAAGKEVRQAPFEEHTRE